MIVKFPKYNNLWNSGKNINHRYYYTHHMYVHNILVEAGAQIEMVSTKALPFATSTAFELEINDKKVCFDISDFNTKTINEKSIKEFDAIFKFHYDARHEKIENMYPFSPISFLNWSLYKKISSKKTYNPTSESPILNNQRPGGAAIERRNYVQNMLRIKYGRSLDISRTNAESFYEKVGNCLVSICVPGARNDMLDRGQGQYMFFGAGTISPKLVTRLSWNKHLIPNEHYIECANDYSDLIEKIEWCKTHLNECKKIGENAKQLMTETSMPEKHIQWIEHVLSK